MYWRDHRDKADSEECQFYPSTKVLDNTLPTSRQRAVIRLRVEVYFDHLTPATGTQDSIDVTDIALPSVRMDATSCHSAVYHVKGVGGEAESASGHSAISLLPSCQVLISKNQ